MTKLLLVLPRLRVQNANCLSSPLTWGFPAMTAFTGFMVALARRMGPASGVKFESIGVICHGFDAQVTRAGYLRKLHLNRSPSLANGDAPAIVEEGRAHLDLSLVFALHASSDVASKSSSVCQVLAHDVAAHVSGMRLAGGSIVPSLATQQRGSRRGQTPVCVALAESTHARRQQFKSLRMHWLAGFALVSRDDILQQHWATLRREQIPSGIEPTLLDAWLDLSRLNYCAARDDSGVVRWGAKPQAHGLVPIPVGYAALSEVLRPGVVAQVRDTQIPFRFVESVYSIGQWVRPHQLRDVDDLMWRTQYDAASGLYRCVNCYAAV